MTELQKQLFEIGDPQYADFQLKLAPTLTRDVMIGVRLPVLRAFAKSFIKTPERDIFMHTLPHDYYDENMLHSILISAIKDPEICLSELRRFLPYVDNWAVCDTLRPAAFKKHRTLLFPNIREWIDSPDTYICRFGIDMLMTHFLDDAFLPEYLEYPAAVRSEEYYVRMMVAWYFATALAKQWNAAIPYIEQHRLPQWTHLKTIQKSIESFRITDEQKEYLRTLK